MKINKKQLQGYLRAKSQWLSANEDYNIKVYGITAKLYRAIKQAEFTLNGICNLQPLTLSKLNKELQCIQEV